MTQEQMLGIIPFVAAPKAERQRLGVSAVFPLMGGTASARAALTAVAMTTQVRDGFRREKKVAGAVITALEAVVSGTEPAAAFAGQKALRDLKPEELATRLTDVLSGDRRPRSPASKAAGDTAAAPDQQDEVVRALKLATAMLIEAIRRPKDRLFAPEEAEEYQAYLEMLSPDTRAKIVKGTDIEIDVVE